MAGAQMGRGRTPTLAAASAVSEFEFSELDFDNCLGSGTYGAVLSGKFISGELTGKDVAAKFPRRLSTWWGTRFNDAERDLLHNLQQKVGVHRNIIRLLGNVSVPTEWLVSRGEGGTCADPKSENCSKWKCLNATDFSLAAKAKWGAELRARSKGSLDSELPSVRSRAPTTPAMVLERFPYGVSFWSLLSQLGFSASVEEGIRASFAKQGRPLRNGSSDALLRLQEAGFRSGIAKAQANTKRPALRRFLVNGSTAGWDAFIGLARGYRVVHGNGIVHRDLVVPGKNVMIKNDRAGLTSSIMDFSAAEACAEGSGSLPRAIDAFYFGEVLTHLCHGRVGSADSYQLLGIHCNSRMGSLSKQTLDELGRLYDTHERAHPQGRASPAAHLLNRCSVPHQSQLAQVAASTYWPLVRLMRRHRNVTTDRQKRSGPESAAEYADMWAAIEHRLMMMRQDALPLLRFVDAKRGTAAGRGGAPKPRTPLTAAAPAVRRPGAIKTS